MAGIEFRVPRSDHRKVEDFIATHAAGVTGIQLEITNVGIHEELAVAASGAGLEVTIDPMTERLCYPGFNPDRIPFGDLYPIDLLALATSAAPRAELTERLLAVQEPLATRVVPAHFYVDAHEAVDLNLALLRLMAALAPDRSLRPIIAVSGRFLTKAGVATAIASAYVEAGAQQVELRVSPIGGQDEGPLKIRKLLQALEGMRSAGLSVTLGCSGLVGHAALALGVADGFSVGVGYREKYNHRDEITRQVALEDEDDDEEDKDKAHGPRGAIVGVYLPGAEITIPRSTAKLLYDDSTIRRHLGCREGKCAQTVNGPLLDPRAHYLHSQSAAVAATIDRPPAWRPTLLQDRLVRAGEVREQIFQRLPPEIQKPKSRTLSSLVDEIDRSIGHQKSA